MAHHPRGVRTARVALSAKLLGLLFLWGLGILSSPCVAAVAEPPGNPQTSFFHANTLYKDGAFAGAAAEYEQIVQAGLASGNLYFNLANAYFKAGDTGKAVLNYERALRLLPGDPDVDANLDYARSVTGVEVCVAPLWQRAVFPLAPRFSAAALLEATVALYSMVFLALAAQRLLPAHPRALTYVAATATAAAVLVGASCTRRLVSDHWQTSAVVTAGGETAARFEPAEAGTVHFSLAQGSVVRVLERRDGWLQAARCDGRRGWVPRSALGDLWPD